MSVYGSVKVPILSFGLCTDLGSDPILKVKDRSWRMWEYGPERFDPRANLDPGNTVSLSRAGICACSMNLLDKGLSEVSYGLPVTHDFISLLFSPCQIGAPSTASVLVPHTWPLSKLLKCVTVMVLFQVTTIVSTCQCWFFESLECGFLELFRKNVNLWCSRII